jgi:hypothetical protein
MHAGFVWDGCTAPGPPGRLSSLPCVELLVVLLMCSPDGLPLPSLRVRRCGTAQSSARRRTGKRVATRSSARLCKALLLLMRRVLLQVPMRRRAQRALLLVGPAPSRPLQRRDLSPRLAPLPSPRRAPLTAVRASSALTANRPRSSRGARAVATLGWRTSSAEQRPLLTAWQAAPIAMGGGSARRAGSDSPGPCNWGWQRRGGRVHSVSPKRTMIG